MAKNYAALANDVVSALGGKENIVAVTHCMTRLRFVLKDESLTDTARLKSISGVLGVVRNDNQCQVIIGNTVSQAYREVVSLLPANLQPAVAEGPQKLTLRRIGAGILDALIGTMSPLIPAIIGGSMVKLLAMILEMTGVLGKGDPTLTILTRYRRRRVLLPAADGGGFRSGEVQNQHVPGNRHRGRAGSPELYRADGQGRAGRAR